MSTEQRLKEIEERLRKFRNDYTLVEDFLDYAAGNIGYLLKLVRRYRTKMSWAIEKLSSRDPCDCSSEEFDRGHRDDCYLKFIVEQLVIALSEGETE